MHAHGRVPSLRVKASTNTASGFLSLPFSPSVNIWWWGRVKESAKRPEAVLTELSFFFLFLYAGQAAKQWTLFRPAYKEREEKQILWASARDSMNFHSLAAHWSLHGLAHTEIHKLCANRTMKCLSNNSQKINSQLKFIGWGVFCWRSCMDRKPAAKKWHCGSRFAGCGFISIILYDYEYDWTDLNDFHRSLTSLSRYTGHYSHSVSAAKWSRSVHSRVALTHFLFSFSLWPHSYLCIAAK